MAFLCLIVFSIKCLCLGMNNFAGLKKKTPEFWLALEFRQSAFNFFFALGKSKFNFFSYSVGRRLAGLCPSGKRE